MSLFIPDYVNKYLEQLQTDGRKLSTIKQYRYDLNLFFKWLDGYKKDNSIDVLKSLLKSDFDTFFKTTHSSADNIRRLANVLDRLFLYLNIQGVKLQSVSTALVKRPLDDKDFVSADSFKQLLLSMKTPSESSTARNYLLDRNIAIVLLMRYYGLTTPQIHAIEMNHINFAQGTVYIDGRKEPISLHADHNKVLLKYYTSIPKDRRPKYRTSDPLFVAFFNKSKSYRYNYNLGKPQRLSVRAIQKMLYEEVDRTGLKNISSVQLRNSYILDLLKFGESDDDIVNHFGFANKHTLKRYKVFLNI